MCECLNTIEKEVFDKLIAKPRYKKPVIKVSLGGVAITFPDCINKSYNEITIELEGQNKKEKMSLFHSFCPFCGLPTNIK